MKKIFLFLSLILALGVVSVFATAPAISDGSIPASVDKQQSFTWQVEVDDNGGGSTDVINWITKTANVSYVGFVNVVGDGLGCYPGPCVTPVITGNLIYWPTPIATIADSDTWQMKLIFQANSYGLDTLTFNHEISSTGNPNSTDTRSSELRIQERPQERRVIQFRLQPRHRKV